jgi:hypothetical protein
MMAGVVRIDVTPIGIATVFIGQTNDHVEVNRLWRLYRAIRPQIQELERAAQREAMNICRDEGEETDGYRQ